MGISLRETFLHQGFAVIENVLNSTEIQAFKDDYAKVLDDVTQRLYQQDKISETYTDLPFAERYTKIITQSDENIYPYFDIALSNADITHDTPIHLSPAVFNLLHNPNILDAIESLIGGEILSNPIQHVRIKPPQVQTHINQSTLTKQTGWHQDQGVSREEADDTEMITVWIAITDATIENGCLQVIPFSHDDGITTHCPSDEMTIPTHLLSGEPLPVPIKAGSALLLHRRTQHSSLANHSSSIRWSFDLRYQPIGQPTGRDEFPSMIVRSRSNPELVQTNYDTWVQSWLDAKATLAKATERRKTHRWDGDAPVCA